MNLTFFKFIFHQHFRINFGPRVIEECKDCRVKGIYGVDETSVLSPYQFKANTLNQKTSDCLRFC